MGLSFVTNPFHDHTSRNTAQDQLYEIRNDEGSTIFASDAPIKLHRIIELNADSDVGEGLTVTWELSVSSAVATWTANHRRHTDMSWVASRPGPSSTRRRRACGSRCLVGQSTLALILFT